MSSIDDQKKKVGLLLVLFHILIITLSNYLVQLPIQIFGFHSTWGTFSLPLVYVFSDLTVKIFGKKLAKKIVFTAMLPGLLLSYLVSVIWHKGIFVGFDGLLLFNSLVARIAIASFIAYLVGQWLDIIIFSKLREHSAWWVAPSCSGVLGNIVDSFIFFSVAFYASSDPFLSTHWVEIALVDTSFKLIISLLFFLPIYGVILNILMKLLYVKNAQNNAS